jgi:hypothetical protein
MWFLWLLLQMSCLCLKANDHPFHTFMFLVCLSLSVNWFCCYDVRGHMTINDLPTVPTLFEHSQAQSIHNRLESYTKRATEYSPPTIILCGLLFKNNLITFPLRSHNHFLAGIHAICALGSKRFMTFDLDSIHIYYESVFYPCKDVSFKHRTVLGWFSWHLFQSPLFSLCCPGVWFRWSSCVCARTPS